MAPDLMEMTKAELQDLAKTEGLSGVSQLNIEPLREKLAEHLAAKESPAESPEGQDPEEETSEDPNDAQEPAEPEETDEEDEDEDEDEDDLPNPDQDLEGKPLEETEGDDDRANDDRAITPDQMKRIANAPTAALQAKVNEVPEPFHGAIKGELKRRKKKEKEAKLKDQPIPVCKVTESLDLWRDGFLSTVPEGTLVSRDEGKRISSQGGKVVNTFAKLQRNAMGVSELVEVEKR